MERAAVTSRRSGRLEPPRPSRVRKQPAVFLFDDVIRQPRAAAKTAPADLGPRARRPAAAASAASAGVQMTSQARADAIAQFLGANPGWHTRRQVIRQLWPHIEFLSGQNWQFVEKDPRVDWTITSESGAASSRGTRVYQHAGSKGRLPPKVEAGAPARTAKPRGRQPDGSAVDTWMSIKDTERRLRAFAGGKQQFEGFKLVPGGASLGAPPAGSVFFQRIDLGAGLSRMVNRLQDDYAWNYSSGAKNDGILKGSATTLSDKQVLKGRFCRLPADRDFQRRAIYLNEDRPSVRMIQYIHSGKQLQPVNGLKRSRVDAEPPVVKKQRPRSPPPRLKDTDICFHHKRCDLEELASQRKQLRYKVVIVGAGAAGLGAARQLIDEQGMDPASILVLEAGDRIGGRIHTKLFEAKAGLPAVRVDLGASYLHGYDFDTFFEKNRSAQKNPLQVLVEKHKLKIKVDEKIEQAYSNGWRGHSAWYINGDGKPAMAKKNYAYKGGEWDGPEEVFLIDLEIDARLEAIVENLSQSERSKSPSDADADADADAGANSLYAHADVDVRTQFDAVRKEILDEKNFEPEKRRRIHELLESLAVVKWGYCGPLEKMSLCDAFGVMSTFGFDYEEQEEDESSPQPTAYDSEAATTTDSHDSASSSSDELPPDADDNATAAAAAAASTVESGAWVRQGMYDAMLLDGYGEVIDILSAGVPVAMNAQVEAIKLDSRGRRGKALVTVRGSTQTSQPHVIQADAVIVTVSLGVLKAGKIAFEPPMDQWSAAAAAAEAEPHRATTGAAAAAAAAGPQMPKASIIDALGFGFENKVVLRFAEKERFWAKRKGGACSHWQTRDQRFRFINLDALGKAGTVVAHVGPPFSVDFKDEHGKTYSDDQVVREVCKTLQEMFALEQPPVAVDSHVTRWAQDELVQGSYSYQKVYSGSDMCESLATPEWGGRLCFAGEACCQTRVQCVDGALVTGRQAADSVATLLK